jgi:histidinol phosphatase-like PHP family hydrolase
MTHHNAEYVDLHIHSTSSDGSLSPQQIVQAARKTHLKAISITDHDTKQRAVYERLALRHGLAGTGGTDFHGAIKPYIRIGIGRGDFHVPYGLVENLKACRP